MPGAVTPVSIVVPAFNEAARLPASLPLLLAYLEKHRPGSEVIVVDDGSRDGTAHVAAALAAARPEATAGAPGTALRVLRHRRNRGKGAAVRTGVRAACAPLVVFLDADLSTPPDELSAVLAPLEAAAPDHADVVIGSRRAAGAEVEVRQPPGRIVIGRLFHAAVTRLFVPGIRDTQCGCKGFTREAARLIFERTWVRGFGFDVEILFAARRLGLTVREVPVRWRNDTRSTVRPLVDGPRVVVEVAKILIAWSVGRYRR